MRFLLALIFALFVNPLLAADNYTATQGTGTTFRAQDVGSGVLSPYVVLGTTAGASIGGTAGTSNSFVLSVQGIASGTKLGISAASGDFASGSLAAGAMVDFLTTRGTKAPGTAAANSLLTGCVYTAAGITLTDGQQAACQLTVSGGQLVSVVNANNNGSATSANSSPVVIASDQVAVAIKAASGVFASGSIASGALASGSIASGAMVDVGAQADSVCATNTGTCSQIALIKRGNANTQGPYPNGSTPYTATATGTTGATTATLAGASSVTTYLCGFSIRANATAAATGNATVTGVITATLNFTQWTAPNASGLGITEMIFAPCIPASTTNTSIAVVSAAPGTGGVVSVTAWGYKL